MDPQINLLDSQSLMMESSHGNEFKSLKIKNYDVTIQKDSSMNTKRSDGSDRVPINQRSKFFDTRRDQSASFNQKMQNRLQINQNAHKKKESHNIVIETIEG